MLVFTLHSAPIPQKQTRFSCAKGFPRAYNPSQKDMTMIQWQIKPYAPKEPLLGPLEVYYSFFLPIPTSTSKIKKRLMNNGTIYHITKPDGSNLMYLVENAMKGIIYRDDAQICRYHVEKLYSDDPRTVIKVIEINSNPIT